MTHSILLIQLNHRPESKRFCDFESVEECMEGVCKMYEEDLKQRHPQADTITYDIPKLFEYIDKLKDLSCLVYNTRSRTYIPYNKEWIKEQTYLLLKHQANTY